MAIRRSVAQPTIGIVSHKMKINAPVTLKSFNLDREQLYCSFSFYRAMHISAKRGIAIACRLSVCPSVRL